MTRYVVQLLAGMTLFATLPLWANDFTDVCPKFTPTGVGTGEVGFDQGCSELITLNSDGSMTFSLNPAYDGLDVEDAYVGVMNHSGHLVDGVRLGGDEPFGFEADGDFGLSKGATGYEGPNTSFTFTVPTVGIVNFTGGLRDGDSRYFGLEGFATPEPSSIVLLGTGVLGLLGAVRKKLTS